MKRFACLCLIVLSVVGQLMFPLDGWAQYVTPYDTIPNFAASPIIHSVATGLWSASSTWSPARVPQSGDVVLITHTVTYDSTTGDVDTIGIESGGTLHFSTAQSTILKVANLLVAPSGTLEVGTVATPIPANLTAEIIIKNKALDISSDPKQFGTSLIGLGTVKMHGSVKSPTFVRLATEPRAGNTTLSLSQAVSGWQAGDRLILPDTRHLRDSEISNWQVINPQWEELTLQSISADGLTLTLTSALRFDHLGARDGNGTLGFLPHVGNLSRNVIIRSEAPIGTGTQGHTLFTNRANIDVRYVAFRDLGRTQAAATGAGNQIGRYPTHMHHLMGPTATPANGYQFTMIGNAVDGGSTTHNLRWGMAIHDSHYGLIQDNVAWNYNGWTIGTEDGSESYNVFDHNFVVRGSGSGGRNGGSFGEANEGGGFTFRGPNNYVRNNVAANIMGNQPDAAYGFKFAFMYLGNINVPNFKGADTSVSGQYTTRDGNSLPVIEFADNEIYGAMGSGFSYWWVGTFGNGYPRATQDSVFKNLHIWHVFNKAIFHYESMRVIYDGLVIRGKDPALSACCREGVAMNDYLAHDVTFRSVDIQGMGSGITASTVSGGGLQTIENSYLRNLTNFTQGTIWTSGADSSWVDPRKVIIRNTRFDAWPGSSLLAISRPWEPTHGSSTNITQRDELFVYDYQGQVGNNFQVYYKEQATQNIAGGLAPCNNTTTRPEINGITCPLTGTPPPSPTVPVAPSVLRVQ